VRSVGVAARTAGRSTAGLGEAIKDRCYPAHGRST